MPGWFNDFRLLLEPPLRFRAWRVPCPWPSGGINTHLVGTLRSRSNQLLATDEDAEAFRVVGANWAGRIPDHHYGSDLGVFRDPWPFRIP